MKNILAVTIIALYLSACTRSTSFGECIGIDDEPVPSLKYRYSLWNAGIALVFSETIIVPIYTLAKQIQCPTGLKEAPHALLDQ
jgi:hypothetical protein